jgi:non-canonical purine NTP pyrophosphatase (RdgB/HAM1 family)
MKLDKITLVTGNKNKAREVERILNIPLEVKSIELDEIQGLDLEKIALHKLNQAFEIVKGPVIIDDVSVEIEAWNDFPGPLIKWLLKAGNDGDASVLLKLLENESNRSAVAKLAIGFHDGKKAQIFVGETKGTIATEIRGDNGFGWDPVFIPEGHNETFAEMDPDLKDSMSHRGRAFAKLSDFIKANYDI